MAQLPEVVGRTRKHRRTIARLRALAIEALRGVEDFEDLSVWFDVVARYADEEQAGRSYYQWLYEVGNAWDGGGGP